ncbi:CPBP family intramembrane glutamic endopeptidase [uncultured Sulfitobacter sp.]|uniref:CPBP family intramembrane glutamic endopeptidase n=1 Tax=uncultured Sulfitobacter sp. TaxID=191468 RepID=UPI002631C5F6|nr:CPBP family intramembrane glutamic endopeptidase [uncultured Sulfitobacter sp.]
MLWRPDYSAHVLHTVVAAKRPEIWRLVLGISVMVTCYILMALFYQQAISELTRYRPEFLDELIAGSTPLAMYTLLLSFGLISVAVFIGVRLVHKRDPLSVFGPMMLAVPQFARVLGILVILSAALMILPPYGFGGELVLNLAPGLWAVLLPLSLLAVFVQISAEEIFFRGYLQQQLAARFRSPLVWMVLPSAVFAFGHYQPEEAGGNAMLIVVWAGLFGILMADLTARAGSIGPAIAVHFVNNVTALVIVALPDSLGGLALWHTPFGMADEAQLRAWMPVDFAMMIVSWLAARLALRR